MQHAGWGKATPPANEVRGLMQKPEIKEAVLLGAMPPELHRDTGGAAHHGGPTNLLQPDHTLPIGPANRLARHPGTPWSPDRKHASHNFAPYDTKAHGTWPLDLLTPAHCSNVSQDAHRRGPPSRRTRGIVHRVPPAGVPWA